MRPESARRICVRSEARGAALTVPAHGKRERRVKHAGSEGVKTARNGEDDRHFTESLGDLQRVNFSSSRETRHCQVNGALTLINITPMMIHATRIPAGPPRVKAEPEPTCKISKDAWRALRGDRR